MFQVMFKSMSVAPFTVGMSRTYVGAFALMMARTNIRAGLIDRQEWRSWYQIKQPKWVN